MIALLLTALAAPTAAPPSVKPQWLSKQRPKKIERIVTVAPALTELLFELGVGDRVVGVSRYDDVPESVKALPKVGGFLDPNVEAIVALRPDLVLAVANAGNRIHLERVAKLNVPVYVVPGNTFADIFSATDAVGSVLGGDAAKRAAELNARLTDTVRDLERANRGKHRTKTLVIYAYNPLVVGGPGSFVDRIIEVAGGDNVAKVGSEYPTYSIEHVLETAPEVIIDATEVATEAPPWKSWTSVPAVRDGRVHRVTMGGFMRPGPRIVEGLRRMSAFLHPPR